MAVLRKLGQLANIFLEDQLKKQNEAYTSNLTKQRQEESYRQNLADKTIAGVGPRYASGEVTPETDPNFDSYDPALQAALRAQSGVAPSKQQRGDTAVAPIMQKIAEMGVGGDAATLPDEDAIVAQSRNAMSVKGVNPEEMYGVNDPALKVRQAMVGQQAQAQRNLDASAARHTTQEQTDYNIHNPEKLDTNVYIDRSGNVPKYSILDPTTGQMRPMTSADFSQLHTGQVHYVENQPPNATIERYGDVKNNAEAIYAGIKNGDIAPDPVGLSRDGTWSAVTGLAAKDKFNLLQASQAWQATKRATASMNSVQFQRLGQTIQTTGQMADLIKGDADAWDGLNIGPLNRATLAAATQGALGPQAQKLAVKLSGQIADVTADLATVYRNGLAPTSDSIALAKKNVEEWWGKDTIHDMVDRMQTNLNIRRNAMTNQGAAMPGGWTPPGAQGTPAGQPATPEELRHKYGY